MSGYGTTAGADAYFAERGETAAWDAVSDKDAALVRGSDYVDQRYRKMRGDGRWVSLFVGQKVGGRSQVREWPRTGAVDMNGNAVDSGSVPIEVETAAYEAAMREGTNPGSLSPDYVTTGSKDRVKVGPIEVSYSTSQIPIGGGNTPNRPMITEIDAILAPLLDGSYFTPAGYAGIGMRLLA